MKKVLLTTTALVMTAGVAAADTSMSASAELTYGNWGTANANGNTAGPESWGSDADVTISMSGEASGIAYSAGLALDQAGNTDGTISMSGSGLSLTYDEDGEMDSGEADLGNLKVAYDAGGISASYIEDVSTGNSEIALGYTAGDMTLGYSTNNVASASTLSASFTAGDLALSVSGNDAGDAWDASAAYTLGASTVTVGTDQASKTYVKVATSLNDISLTAKALDGDNELTVGYTMGDITLSYAYDSGDAATLTGGDAQTVMSIAYDLGGIVITGKTNNVNEVEVSAAFTF